MKTDVLLISDRWDESSAIVAEAANRTGHGFRHLSFAHADELLSDGASETDLIVVGVDHDDFSMVDAIAQHEEMPPVIVVAHGNRSRLREAARQHGAAAFVPRPFTLVEMEWAIEELCPSRMRLPISCDPWGHPCVPRKCAFCH